VAVLAAESLLSVAFSLVRPALPFGVGVAEPLEVLPCSGPEDIGPEESHVVTSATKLARTEVLADLG
jgi:hypothetical protein